MSLYYPLFGIASVISVSPTESPRDHDCLVNSFIIGDSILLAGECPQCLHVVGTQ